MPKNHYQYNQVHVQITGPLLTSQNMLAALTFWVTQVILECIKFNSQSTIQSKPAEPFHKSLSSEQPKSSLPSENTKHNFFLFFFFCLFCYPFLNGTIIKRESMIVMSFLQQLLRGKYTSLVHLNNFSFNSFNSFKSSQTTLKSQALQWTKNSMPS